MTKVFINGSNGTTGLRIVERLSARADLTLVSLPEAERKDARAQAALAAEADITFLCLPDEASRELISLLPEDKGRVLDTSTAFRTDARFTYGFPELSPAQADGIAQSRRVAVPGCHASGAIALLYPLLRAGVLAADAPLSLTSLTGYSGGGKKMIAQYEDPTRDPALDSPRSYALAQGHKHLPEIAYVCGLAGAPVFLPIVDDYYAGMTVLLPLPRKLLVKPLTPEELTALYAAHYAGPGMVRVLPANAEGIVAANALTGSDRMDLLVAGTEERLVALAKFDNLGKGASGAAIQCMNLMLGLDPRTGLAESFAVSAK